MRIRHKPYARPELAAWPHHINDPVAQRDAWPEAFADPGLPLRLELGCGKGGFITALALRDSGINFLGVDIKSEMLVVAKRTAVRLFAQQGREIGNLAFTAYNIERVSDIFPDAPITDRIYINFCNPWTRPGHNKHRLTHPRQLLLYRSLLGPEGEIYFKTDNDELFQDSLRYFPLTGYEVVWSDTDLHKNEPGWNLRTEHEHMFSSEGIPINACIAKKIPATLDIESIRRSKDI